MNFCFCFCLSWDFGYWGRLLFGIYLDIVCFQNFNLGGSGGGGLCGGSGGGNIYIYLDVLVQIDGLLLVNGIVVFGFDCGGGSGGLINIVINFIEGIGVILVNGGDGQGSGGGGGGGCILVRYIYDRFMGIIISVGGFGGRY